MENLRITLVQTILDWEDPISNRFRIGKELLELKGKTDLVILPEMFTTGFSMEPARLAEKMDGPTMHWMEVFAEHLEAVLCGSVIIEENGNYYNRLIWMRPDGSFEIYDKRHLFAMAGEDKHYEAGKERLITTVKGWKVCPLVCYDLRFPVWARNTVDYDLLIYIANWPEKRSYAWNSLLQARAIENQSYVVGVNRVGSDENGITYTGDSQIFGPMGNVALYYLANKEEVYTTELESSEIRTIREKLPFLADRDQFRILEESKV